MDIKYLKYFFFIIAAINLGTSSMVNAKSAFNFEFDSIDGGVISFSDYQGNVILVVNTASECGFTRQYEGLQSLWNEYKEDGLVVIGVPSNDFGGQEPGTNDQIKRFCAVNFNINFPMTAKTFVKGEKAHPFYKWVNDELGWRARPKWNFHKYLIARDGSLQESFSSMVSAESSKLRKKIDQLLAKSKLSIANQKTLSLQKNP